MAARYAAFSRCTAYMYLAYRVPHTR
eukprot:COSAG01_NODE_23597_length_809_cov_1.050704_1_plen_25_part_10